MIFSVFNDHSRDWQYFEGPGTSANYGSRGTKYRPLHGRPSGPSNLGGSSRGLGPIGFVAESLAVPLPSNVRPIGRGTVARGIVAVVPRTGVRPAYPAQWEEWAGNTPPSGRLEGLAGTDGTDGTDGSDVPAGTGSAGIPLSKVIVAACVASVVGVIVQRMLR